MQYLLMIHGEEGRLGNMPKADVEKIMGAYGAYTQALKDAGPHPSRGSILKALRSIHSFSGGNLVGTSNPAAKVPTNCYIIATIAHGKYQRLDDPPLSGQAHGYRCDKPFYYAK